MSHKVGRDQVWPRWQRYLAETGAMNENIDADSSAGGDPDRRGAGGNAGD